MMVIAMTYDVATPESAEHGDCSDRGYIFTGQDCTAHELARYIKREGFTVPSESHGVPRWLSNGGDLDYKTGATETRHIHPGADAQSQKVWARVLRICGIAKGQA